VVPEPLTEALRGLTEGLSPRLTHDLKPMPCVSCGDSNTEAIREIWRQYRSVVDDIEGVGETKALLRSFFSEGDDWTDQDEKIGHAMSSLDSVTMTLVDLAGKYKAEHKTAMDADIARLEAEAATAEVINEAKAAATVEAE